MKMPRVTCPKCRATNVGFHAACPRCQTPLPRVLPRLCERCGAINLGGHVACPFCRGPLSAPSRATGPLPRRAAPDINICIPSK
jgi:hypothetical protein